mmetsp:Transcript_37754/g.52427  ORF Transcript_37754/g.52427 Transcript_37754/m.52427 type:complete len:347 (-) Transcript_37754:140-1180(-)
MLTSKCVGLNTTDTKMMSTFASSTACLHPRLTLSFSSRISKQSSTCARLSCTSSSLSDKQQSFVESEKGENLKYWVIGNGGVIHEGLKVVENAPCGERGVVCTETMTSADVEASPLVLVPESLYLTSQVARVGFEYYEELGAPSLAELDMPTQLAILLAHEKFHLGEESFYHPYVDILPARPPCAWAKSDEELESALHAALSHSETLWDKHAHDWREHTKSTRSKFHQHAQGVEGRYKDFFNIDSAGFLWAMGHVLSRSFSSHPQLGLAPFIDLLNHHPAASHPELVQVQEEEGVEEFFYYVTSAKDGEVQPIQYGEELHIKYHDYDTPPMEAFMSYGFVPDELWA